MNSGNYYWDEVFKWKKSDDYNGVFFEEKITKEYDRIFFVFPKETMNHFMYWVPTIKWILWWLWWNFSSKNKRYIHKIKKSNRKQMIDYFNNIGHHK